MNDETDDPAARRLRQILAREANDITPAPDGLGRIRARLGNPARTPAWKRPLVQVSAAAAATIAIAGAGVSIVRAQHSSHVGRPASSATQTSITSKTTPLPSGPFTSSATSTHDVRIFYVGALRNPRQVLYREIVPQPPLTPEAAISAAVMSMLRTPSSDHDYTSYWPADTNVLAVDVSAKTATINLSASAANGPATYGLISAQQLAYTVEAADPAVTAVTLSINGQAVTSLWGAVIGDPITTGDAAVIFAPVWITSPTQGQTVSRALTFTGEATAPEGTVNWQILAPDGHRVASSYATATVGAPMRGNWTATVTLAPGTYTLRAFIEPQDGAGTPSYVDEKTFSVH